MTARSVAQAPRAAFIALPPRLRRRLVVAAGLAAVLAAGYVGWLRDSSLVAVERVEVSGLTAPSAKRIEAALVAAGKQMTTLHVRRDELERAVAPFPVVDAIRVEADFPHGLRVRVVEHRPVAVLTAGGSRMPVAGDGTVLPDVEVGGAVPTIRADVSTASGRLSDAGARALVAVAGAAPPALLARAERIAPAAGRGIVAQLKDGPELVFGDGTRARAKWAAAAAVLADPSSRGASYLDLRIPERPAAGGLGAETVEPLDPAGSQPPPPASQPQPQVEGPAGG